MRSDMELAALQEENLANTILAISREFVSNKPYDEVLLGVCRRVAGFVRCLLASNADAWYAFPDTRLRECSLFRLPVSGSPAGLHRTVEWDEDWMAPAYRFKSTDEDALCDLLGPSFAKGRDAAREFIAEQKQCGREFGAFSLCRLAPPMGYVILPVNWKGLDLERIAWHLDDLQRKAFGYFEAFYQATSRTYLPSFYQRTTKPAAILYCDLRNSTTVFQVLRIGGNEHIRKLLVFLKIFMELAAEYIVSSGLGTIHGFTGDGFIATFGEHLGGGYEKHAAGACAIAAFVAERLHRGFDRLYATWREGMQSFDLEHNEDVGLRLGTGLAYGPVHFDEFGTSRGRAKDGTTRPGLLYYNAVGDHMNVAARLCSIASADPAVVDVADRLNQSKGDSKTQPARGGFGLEYIAPMVMTKPFALALAQAQPARLLSELRYMTVGLKGIGNRIPAIEIWPQSLDLRWLPEEAARSATFPPEQVAAVADRVADKFYGEQVRSVAALETETVKHLIDKLKLQMAQGAE